MKGSRFKQPGNWIWIVHVNVTKRGEGGGTLGKLYLFSLMVYFPDIGLVGARGVDGRLVYISACSSYRATDARWPTR